VIQVNSLRNDDLTDVLIQLDSKIDLLDPPEVVNRKIKKATAAPKIIEENGVVALVEFVLLPAAALSGRREFRVDRERDGLEPLIYTNIEKVHEDYKNDIRKFPRYSPHEGLS
jgi:tyrosyl-tRNA synthetase